MFRMAVKSLLARKLRLVSTALAVVLGVAFLAGTLVFTDTIKTSFDSLFRNGYRNTDAYVRSSTEIEVGLGFSIRGRISESVIDEIRDVPGVEEAQGYVTGFAQLVGSDGEPLGNSAQSAPTFGESDVPGPQSAWNVVDGRRPGPGELMIDKGSSKAGRLRVGDTVTIVTQIGTHRLPLVGIARYGTADSPMGATAAVLDLATAQQLLIGSDGQVDAVMVRGIDGVSQTDLTARIEPVLPTGSEVLTGKQITAETQSDFRQALGFFTTFLLVFAVIGLVVACFTIYNTFQIIISQRTREMALMRALGATRRQVLGGQLNEAILVGLAASGVGLAVGVLVARALKALMAAFGIDFPGGGTVLTSRTVIAAIVVGTVVTVASAVLPSLRASRIPPIAAIRDLAIDASGRSRRALMLGGAAMLAGLVAFVVGLAGSGIAWVGAGALLVFLGTFTLGPLIARPVSRVLGLPFARLGMSGELARENAMRNPKRTARTGSALMVGVALVVSITIIAASAKDWIRDVFGEQFSGDFVVAAETTGFGGLSTQVADQLNALPEVAAASGVRTGFARLVDSGSDTMYVAIDPVTAATVFDVGMVSGSVGDLSDAGVFVHSGEASKRGVGVGDVVEFGFLNGTTKELVVAGIYTKDDLAGKYVVTHTLHEQTGADQFDTSVFIAKKPGVDAAQAREAIRAVSDAYPNAKLRSRSEYVDAQSAQVDQLVNLMYGLLGLAVIIALISIANSMVLSIHERTRELGLLRAVGMTRRQTRTAISLEAVLIALLGAIVGLVVGLLFGWSISVTLRDEGFKAVGVPVTPLIAITLLAVVGAVIASMRPAWRASRLDVLRAISSE
jgi:putative ABC transport system permease protein